MVVNNNPATRATARSPGCPILAFAEVLIALGLGRWESNDSVRRNDSSGAVCISLQPYGTTHG